jgi:galactokinase
VTSATLKDQLAAAGVPAARVDAASRLFDAALALLAPVSEAAPVRGWWVPGRLEVFGKHTDYGGGHSLVCAVPRGFAVVARGRHDGVVRLLDAVRGEDFTVFPAARPGPDDEPPNGWRNYAQTVVHRLARNFPRAPLGADVAFASDLPSASGMSSSSALVVATAVALTRVAGLRNRPEWQQAIRTPAGEAGYYACIENGMTFRGLAGDAGVGTHGGSEDHAAIVCGRRDELTAWRFVPLVEVAGTAVPADWTFVIAASGVAARKTGDAREAYNALSARVRLLLDLWRRHESDAPSLAAALRSSADATTRLLTLLERHIAVATDREPLVRRLRHFIDEDARVLDALDACRAADRDRLGRLADASQVDAESLLGNQVAETMWLARRAREHGAFAASSFGAGFGGSVWALIDRDDAEPFAERWLADYRTAFPERTAATSFTMRPARGVAEIF